MLLPLHEWQLHICTHTLYCSNMYIVDLLYTLSHIYTCLCSRDKMMRRSPMQQQDRSSAVDAWETCCCWFRKKIFLFWSFFPSPSFPLSQFFSQLSAHSTEKKIPPPSPPPPRPPPLSSSSSCFLVAWESIVFRRRDAEQTKMFPFFLRRHLFWKKCKISN